MLREKVMAGVNERVQSEGRTQQGSLHQSMSSIGSIGIA